MGIFPENTEGAWKMTDYAIVITQLSILLTITVLSVAILTYIGLIATLWLIGKLLNAYWWSKEAWRRYVHPKVSA